MAAVDLPSGPSICCRCWASRACSSRRSTGSANISRRRSSSPTRRRRRSYSASPAMAPRIMLEPCKRDSAPAIALAAALADDDELLLVCPSDHHIADVAAFHTAIGLARPAAEAGRIVTFGIEPDHPATGFGYIAAGEGSEAGPSGGALRREAAARARRGNARGGRPLLERRHLSRLGPDLARGAGTACARNHGRRARGAGPDAVQDGPVIRVDEEAFAASPAKSIDYAVMEHSTQVSVVPVSMGWSDIGSWQSLVDASDKDEAGNASPPTSWRLTARTPWSGPTGPRSRRSASRGWSSSPRPKRCW